MHCCKFCPTKTFKTLKAFFAHSQFHRSSGAIVPCGVDGCKRSFNNFKTFTSHLSTHHSKSKSKNADLNRQSQPESRVIVCNVADCVETSVDIKSYTKHISQHLEAGTSYVKCPFDCRSKLSTIGSFKNHISTYHPNRKRFSHQDSQEFVSVRIDDSQNCNTNDEVASLLMDSFEYDHGKDSEGVWDSDLYEKTLAVFYLKLQSKYLLPSSTIQFISEEFTKIYTLAQTHMQDLLLAELQLLNVQPECTRKIIAKLSVEDPFMQMNSRVSGLFRTSYKRIEYFKKFFKYTTPLKINLGLNKFNLNSHCYYVPIKETLASLFTDESFLKQYHNPIVSNNPDILCDVTDGNVFKNNEFFQNNPTSLKLMLYQDCFETSNPLGSAKTKYEMLGVYMTLADIYPQHRSKVDSIQLVMMCSKHDFEEFGPSIVFKQLVDDIRDLETTGINVNGVQIKGGLLTIVGDNLGSHQIGGFQCNFSCSEYLCRYCNIKRCDLQTTENLQSFVYRTPESFNEAVTECNRLKQHLEPNSVAANKLAVMGIKNDSIFNQLSSFHVCSPGLPPCLAHDLFEGVVRFDLALCLKNLVKTEKWFTMQEINAAIDKIFKLGVNDLKDKPATQSINLDKISGHAMQTSSLLRMLPFYLGLKVQDPDNPVWRLILQLQEIVELITSPKISKGQISYLSFLIEEYLSSRKSMFEIPLRPKHHYLRHYPWLILQFGPLSRSSTLRFESKHRYFKECVRKCCNRKNVTKTLAEKHELLQALLRYTLLFNEEIILSDAVPYDEMMFSVPVDQEIKSHFNDINNLDVCYTVIAKGVSYKQGHFIVLRKDLDTDSVVFGKIKFMLHDNSNLTFFVEETKSDFNPDLMLHELQPSSNGRKCKSYSELLDIHSYHSYNLQGHHDIDHNRRFVKLKHSLLDV